jgi:UDP:flavonoid glycosyltransferase YjiC (YdhE family)
MKIGMQTCGGMGDIRPFMALATGLSHAGHEVTVAVTKVDDKDYEEFAKFGNFSIKYTSEYSDKTIEVSEEIEKKPTVEIWRNSDDENTQLINDYFVVPMLEEMYSASKDLCANSDIVIGYQRMFTLQCAAEKTNTPYIVLAIEHTETPSGYFPPYNKPFNKGNEFNLKCWQEVRENSNRLNLSIINNFREKENLPLVENVIDDVWLSKELNLLAVSSVFCQQPPDWKNKVEICGFMNIFKEESHWKMPFELDEFINSGTSPVFVSLGSMPIFEQDPAYIMKLCFDAIALAGCRAIIQSKWDGFDKIENNPNIYRVGYNIPHSLIFPFCAAVVHHGGSGTTNTATQYGCPSIIIEYLFDQKFWGSILVRIGLTTKVLSRKSVDAFSLAHEIKVVLNSNQLKSKAKECAEIMKHENGVQRAIALIEEKFS